MHLCAPPRKLAPEAAIEVAADAASAPRVAAPKNEAPNLEFISRGSDVPTSAGLQPLILRVAADPDGTTT